LSKQQNSVRAARPVGSAELDPSSKPAEKAGLLRFFREMGSALVMALIAIVYVIQAFQIPTGSMEDSLLVGDFLLGLKFVYGAPLLPYSRELGVTRRLPAVAKPKPGDVVIFKYPGADAKDYIKRLVAGPGDTVRFAGGKKLIVNGKELNLPPRGKHAEGNRADPRIADFAPLRIPAKGDAFCPDTMPVREFAFLKTLVHQENPTKKVYMYFDLYVDGEHANGAVLNFSGGRHSLDDLQGGKFVFKNDMTRRVEAFDFNRIDDWTMLDNALEIIRRNFPPDKSVEIRKKLYIGNEPVESYTVRNDNYFMAGDNRGNSLDSRYWGYLNYNFVKAKALILYFSYDNANPAWKLPANIRWNRIGKLIRSWDGENEGNPKIKY
jgi:signal peptidase I